MTRFGALALLVVPVMAQVTSNGTVATTGTPTVDPGTTETGSTAAAGAGVQITSQTTIQYESALPVETTSAPATGATEAAPAATRTTPSASRTTIIPLVLPSLLNAQNTQINYAPSSEWNYDPGGGLTPPTMWSKDPTAEVVLNYIGGAVIYQAAQKYDRGYFNVTLDSIFQGSFDLFNASQDGSGPLMQFVFNVTALAEHRLILQNHGNDSRIQLTDERTALVVDTFVIDDMLQIPANSISSVRPLSTQTPGSSVNGGGSSNAGAIAGGVVGGIAGVALIVLFTWYCIVRRRRKVRASNESATGNFMNEAAPVSIITTTAPGGTNSDSSGSRVSPDVSDTRSTSPFSDRFSDQRLLRASTLRSADIPAADNETGTFSDVQGPAFVREAVDMAPPLYNAVYSPTGTVVTASTGTEDAAQRPSAADTGVSRGTPLPALPSEVPVATAKGWMPNEGRSQ